MYAVAEPTLRPVRPGGEPAAFEAVDELVRAIRLGRSATAFVLDRLATPPWQDSMVVKKFSPIQYQPVANLEQRFPQLSSLRDLVDSHCESQQKQACLHALDTLFNSITFLTDNPGDTQQMGLIWGWGNSVDPVFLDMCSARHPVALVILAHYGVLMNLNAGLWHLRAWPAALLEHIESIVNEDWRGSLDWPSQMINTATTTSPSTMISSFTTPSEHSRVVD